MSVAPRPPAYPAWPQQHPPRRPRRGWLALAAAFIGSAAVFGAIATVITMQATPTPRAPAAPPTPTVTVTAAPPTETTLPAAQADAETCHAWGTASTLVTAAQTAMTSVVPPAITLTNPEMQSNPTYAAAATKAGDLYTQAGDTLADQIAVGTSAVLEHAATVTASALRTLGEAYRTFDPANGNASTVYGESEQTMNAVCP